LKVSTKVKLLCNVLKISGGANAPNALPLVACLCPTIHQRYHFATLHLLYAGVIMQLYKLDHGFQFPMEKIILEPEIKPKTLDAWIQR